MSRKITSRSLKAMAMKEKIQREALELFEKKGFEATSIEDIAEAAGCSPGNIYYYFSGKQALTGEITHVVDARYQELYDRYFAADNQMSAEEKFMDFSSAALTIDSEMELLFQCFVYSIRHPEQHVLRLDETSVYLKTLRRIADELIESGVLREGADAEPIVHQFVIMNRGILLQWRIEEGGFDIAEEGRRMAESLLYGYVKDEGRRETAHERKK